MWLLLRCVTCRPRRTAAAASDIVFLEALGFLLHTLLDLEDLHRRLALFLRLRMRKTNKIVQIKILLYIENSYI